MSRIGYFIRLRKRVFETLNSERVDLVIPIDYPGFNLRLARRAHSEGRKVLYYVAPQVWAWHASRVVDLARDTDRVGVILPFEEEFLRTRGVPATFVGHPLLDVIHPSVGRTAWMMAAGLNPERPLLALMPGSRRQELRRHLSLFEKSAREILRHRPDVQVMIGVPAGIPDSIYQQLPFPITRDFRGLLTHATAALVKSGTTTLETALAGTPFVVVYRLNPISYRIAERMVRVPHIALANLVANERVVPEFIQDEATPEVLAQSLLPLLDMNSPVRAGMLERLGRTRSLLGGGGATERVADIARELLGVR
jgi:lipid-A-disaccharide synthase